MNTSLRCFLLGCVLTSRLMASDGKTKKPSFNVMSWNIRYDNPRDGADAWRHRRDWVAKIIEREKVDIAGLQEVLLRQLKDLKARLPKMAVYGVGRDDGKAKGEHAPILYRKDRFTLLDKSTFWLSKTPGKAGSRDWDAAITRIASWVKLKDRRTGEVFYVINTHFDHRGRLARANSAALLVQRLRKNFSDHPVVLTGDFNATPGSKPIRNLTVAGQRKDRIFNDARRTSATKPTGPDSTWNGFRAIVPKRRIDFVFVAGPIRVRSHRVLADQRKGRFPSDHLPVLTQLILESRKK